MADPSSKQKAGNFEEWSKTESKSLTQQIFRTKIFWFVCLKFGQASNFGMIQMILYQTKSDWLLL